MGIRFDAFISNSANSQKSCFIACYICAMLTLVSQYYLTVVNKSVTTSYRDRLKKLTEMVPFDAMIEGAMMDSLTSSASLPVSSLASMTSEAL